ncbi:MAG: choice-of-anchor V domain-containing protein [Bacteroidota bacterium]
MKKIIITLVLASVTLISTSAFIKSSSGIAGYTGSPGEVSCNTIGCHGGGSSPASAIVVSAVPAFTNDEFVPGTSYMITVQLTATNFNRYGFGCEILDASNINAGTMQNAGAGVKFLFSGGRKNAVHTTAKIGTGGASFSFEWVAPSTGDTATIYVAGNAVNGNGSTSGDFPIPPVFVQLNAQEPEPEPVSIRENTSAFISGVSVFPNPANGLTSISYNLSKNQPVSVQLVSLNGKVVREFINETQVSGEHSHFLDLNNIAPGMYFVKMSVADQKVSQKIIAVH